MPKFLNNRRRVLGLLALLGAPGLARAQASSEVTCKEVITRQDKVKASYYRKFDLANGKLTPQMFGDYSDISALPTKIQLTEGFSDAAAKPASAMDDPFFPSDAIYFRVSFRSDGAMDGSFFASIRVPGPVSQCGVVLVTSAGQMAATSGGFPPLDTDPNVLTLYAHFEPVPEQALTGPIQVGVYYNNALNTIVDFDLSAYKSLDQIKARNTDLLGKTGLSIDPATNTVTGAETCSYSPPSTYDSTYTGAPCFFTTAAVDTLGLGDDCWELSTLRRFRDGPLAETPEGRALTQRYYAEAPRLVDGVNRRADAARRWLSVYWTHVLPCAIMARMGLKRMAVHHYRDLFARLERLA